MKANWIILFAIVNFLVACRADLDSTASKSKENAELHTINEDVSNLKAYLQHDWNVVKSYFRLNIPENKRIKREKDIFLKNSHYVKVVLQDSEPYLPFIIRQLKNNDMPIELALLPFIESNYKIKPVKRGRAAGIWQIMPVTGKSLNLKQTRYYDARLDISSSTSAAISYLNTLNKQFNGDWLLTLAAYNSGSTTVRRAMRKNEALNLPTDYWSLSLPQETMRYIPKFLAILEIIRNNEEYEVSLPEFEENNQLLILQMKEKIPFQSLAKLLKINPNELKKLNPAFSSKIIEEKSLIYAKKSDVAKLNKQDLEALINIKRPIIINFAPHTDIETIDSINFTNEIYSSG